MLQIQVTMLLIMLHPCFELCNFQVMLPDQMPAHFQATYTPIAAAGTQAQIKHLSRLLATQLTAVGLGKGYSETQAKTKVLSQFIFFVDRISKVYFCENLDNKPLIRLISLVTQKTRQNADFAVKSLAIPE